MDSRQNPPPVPMDKEQGEEKENGEGFSKRCSNCDAIVDNSIFEDETPITYKHHGFCSHYCKKQFIGEQKTQMQMTEMG